MAGLELLPKSPNASVVALYSVIFLGERIAWAKVRGRSIHVMSGEWLSSPAWLERVVEGNALRDVTGIDKLS